MAKQKEEPTIATSIALVEDLTPAIFSEKGKVESIIKDVRTRVSEFKGDISTDRGRKQIASFAMKIARSKTAIDSIGKEVVAEWKNKAKIVDEQRRLVREEFDAMKEQVRQPLTDWENQEKERIEKFERDIAEIINAGSHVESSWREISIEAMEDRLAELKTDKTDINWQEFSQRANEALDVAIHKHEKAIAERRQWEAEKAELEAMRKEKEERERKEREEAIRREAEEKAKREAEQAFKESEARAKAAKEAQEKAEAEAAQARKEAIEKAERDAAEAARREKEAAELAAKQERERIEAEKQKEAEEAAAREADKKHRAGVIREAKKGLVGAGLNNTEAELAINAIANSFVPNVTIKF